MAILNSGGIEMICSIRPWRIEDAADLASALNNKKIHDNLRDGLPFPYTTKDAEWFITAMLNSDKNETYAFAITIDDRAIGSIGVFRKENVHSRTAEMGYYISEEYWGKGIGTNAVKQMCDYIFANTDIIRIFADPFAYNTASCRVLEKAGFEFEGLLRKNAVKNGKILDMKMYSLLRDLTLEEASN
jgi:RimJ/RimL family protein N-acetyltransferase